MSVAISWDNKMQLAECDIMVGFPISSHIYVLAVWEWILKHDHSVTQGLYHFTAPAYMHYLPIYALVQSIVALIICDRASKRD